MVEETQTTTDSSVDRDRLTRWMDEHRLPGSGSDLTITSISGGSQNQLLELRRDEHRLVLRAAPPHATPDRAARMKREYELVSALRDTDVPHARTWGHSDDTEIVGQPFYVMDHIDGWSPMHKGWIPPFDDDLDARAGLAFALVDGIARLANVDWKAKGLENFGRPDGFHERQVDRWLNYLATYQFRELPGVEAAATWLRENKPAGFRPGIMHGDYQFANVMFHHGAPARLAAIVDWEMSTVGDPLLDLGWTLVAWSPEGDDMVHSRYLDLTGMPPRDDLLEHYASVSGLPVDHIDYYVILARFKLGIVLEQTVARQVANGTPVEETRFSPIVLELLAKAAELSQRTVLR